jgi:hypothetical protein
MKLCNYNWNVTSTQAYSVIVFDIAYGKYDILNKEDLNIFEHSFDPKNIIRFTFYFERAGRSVFFTYKYTGVWAIIDKMYYIYLINKDRDYMQLIWDFTRGEKK